MSTLNFCTAAATMREGGGVVDQGGKPVRRPAGSRVLRHGIMRLAPLKSGAHRGCRIPWGPVTVSSGLLVALRAIGRIGGRRCGRIPRAWSGAVLQELRGLRLWAPAPIRHDDRKSARHCRLLPTRSNDGPGGEWAGAREPSRTPFGVQSSEHQGSQLTVLICGLEPWNKGRRSAGPKDRRLVLSALGAISRSIGLAAGFNKPAVLPIERSQTPPTLSSNAHRASSKSIILRSLEVKDRGRSQRGRLAGPRGPYRACKT
jgi:hypothetical protein